MTAAATLWPGLIWHAREQPWLYVHSHWQALKWLTADAGQVRESTWRVGSHPQSAPAQSRPPLHADGDGSDAGFWFDPAR